MMLGTVEYLILDCIEEKAVTSGQIMKRIRDVTGLNYTRGAINSILNRMHRKKYVSAIKTAEHGQQGGRWRWDYRLTEEGQRRLSIMRRLHRSVLERKETIHVEE